MNELCSFNAKRSQNQCIFTLKGCKRPMHICTRRLCPSETLCIRHLRLISRRSISFSLLTGSIPSTAWKKKNKKTQYKHKKTVHQGLQANQKASCKDREQHLQISYALLRNLPGEESHPII